VGRLLRAAGAEHRNALVVNPARRLPTCVVPEIVFQRPGEQT
jgi:hypothetical protein